MRTVTQEIGGGVDHYVETNRDPEDTIRWRQEGDAYPRVAIDPWLGAILTGPGDEAPTAAGLPESIINVDKEGITPNTTGDDATAIANSYVLAVLMSQRTGKATTFYFPSARYEFYEIGIANHNHVLMGARSDYTDLVYRGTTGKFITIAGPNAGSRIFGAGLSNLKLVNNGPGTSVGLYWKFASHCFFERVWWTSFRGSGGGVDCYNAMDSFFYQCCWDYCGSADATNKPVIRMRCTGDGGDTVSASVNEVRFVQCRFENNSDRLIEAISAGGLVINRIYWTHCKFENSVNDGNGLNGSNDANQAQVWLDGVSNMTFTDSDFTLQDKQAAYVLQTIFRLKNSTQVFLNSVEFAFGAGSRPQCFTNFFVLDNASQVLCLQGVMINSGNATAFPTNVISVTNAPAVIHNGCFFHPFQGSAKTITDFLTGSVVNTGAAGTSGTGHGVVS